MTMLNDEQRKILPEWATHLASPVRWGRFGALDECQCDLCQKRRMLAAFATALLELKEAREVLKSIEWCFLGSCPVCGEDHSSGHLDDNTMLERGPCKLARILGEGKGE